jgi:hypothetical protein
VQVARRGYGVQRPAACWRQRKNTRFSHTLLSDAQLACPHPTAPSPAKLGHTAGVRDDSRDRTARVGARAHTPSTRLTAGRAGVLHYINEATPVFASSLLPCVFASVLSSLLPYRPLKDNNMAGTSERSGGYRQLLSTLIFTNAAAAFVQLCGAMLLAGALLTGRSTSSDLRRGVVLVCSSRHLSSGPDFGQACTFIQLPCCFAPCIGIFGCWLSPKTSQTNDTGLEGGRSGGVVWYKSLESVSTPRG